MEMVENKKGVLIKRYPFFLNIFKDYFNPLTNFVSLDLLLEALFLCMMFFLAKRSSIEITLLRSGVASVLSVVIRNLLIADLVVFA